MLTKLEESSGSVVGYSFTGAIDKCDYEVLIPEMKAIVKQYGTVQILCDLREFTSERPSAWLDDWHFGREFHEHITKMAIVGDKKWEGVIASLARGVYAQQARRFTDPAQAWKWLTQPS